MATALYVINPDDPTQPTENLTMGAAAAELRGLKQRVLLAREETADLETRALTHEGANPYELDAQLNANENKITELPQATEASDAVPLSQVLALIGAAGSGIVASVRQKWIATEGQTVFLLTMFSYVPTANNIAVYVEGIRQDSGTAYLETNSTSFTFTEGLQAGSVVHAFSNESVNADAVAVLRSDLASTASGKGAEMVATTAHTFTKVSDALAAIDWAQQKAPSGVNVLRYIPPSEWPALLAGSSTYDATAAIQAAVNSTGTSGGTIYLPKGVYKVSSAIQINGRSNVRFVGVGISGAWTDSNYGTTIEATSSAIDVFAFTNYSYNCSVEGMQIVSARRAITFTNCLGWYVEKVNLRNNVTGIEAFGNGVGHIKGCWIRNNGTGINLLKSSGDTLVGGNDIGANNVGVFVGTGTVRIVNNSIFYSRNAGAGVGILIDSVNGAITDAVVRATVIAHNLIAANDTQIAIRGVDLASRGVREVWIHHNHMHQADDGGEGFDGGFAYGYGIYIEYADRIHINHNNIIGMRDYGIKAVGSLNGVFVDHNVIKSGNGAGIIFDYVQWGRIDINEFLDNTGTAIQMLCYNTGDWNQNNRVIGNSFRSNGAIYTEDARTRANVILDNFGGTLANYSLNTVAPVSQLRHISQGGNQESLKNQSLYVDGAAWNGSRIILGSHNLWVDASGRLRIKSGTPASDTDGTVVGAQT